MAKVDRALFPHRYAREALSWATLPGFTMPILGAIWGMSALRALLSRILPKGFRSRR